MSRKTKTNPHARRSSRISGTTQLNQLIGPTTVPNRLLALLARGRHQKMLQKTKTNPHPRRRSRIAGTVMDTHIVLLVLHEDLGEWDYTPLLRTPLMPMLHVTLPYCSVSLELESEETAEAALTRILVAFGALSDRQWSDYILTGAPTRGLSLGSYT
ncbi:hypothetical protein BDW74DRAFT_180038 [Aspergillus multicolor]|uniref:uncharacterized protein n=1 Tax=Aspergillus multicolor TaxID=41759 RepID=UPI003CCCC582